MRRLILAALLLSAGSASAQPPRKAPKAGQPESTPAALRQRLDAPLTLRIEPTNLNDAVEKLAEATKLPIRLDQTMLQLVAQNGDGNEPTVSLDAKGVKLKTALHKLFGPIGMTHAVVGGEIFIADEDTVVFRQFKQRVSFDLEAVPLKTFVKQVRGEYGVNILIDPRATKAKLDDAPVTMSIDEVPLETALRLAGEMAGAKAVRVGNVILITTEDRAEKLKDNESLVQPPAGAGFGGGIMLGGGVQVFPNGGAVPQPVAPAEESVPAPKEVTDTPKEDPAPEKPKE